MTQTATLLAIDAGNTRTKWGAFDAQGHLLNTGAALNSQLDEINFPTANRVMIANVAGEAHANMLAKKLAGAEVTFATATAEACGILNSYENPAQLGIDRWAALIGAWRLKKTSCVVVNAGTAMTIDALIVQENQAKFIGGMILPGLQLMQKSLHVGTAALPNVTEFALNDGGFFGKNTQQAIINGTWAAAIGAMSTFYEAVKSTYQQTPMCILSGGSAAQLQQNFFKEHQPNTVMDLEVINHLVLHGLCWLSHKSNTP